jgi:tetratricopeptide (TPR) repeat protein
MQTRWPHMNGLVLVVAAILVNTAVAQPRQHQATLVLTNGQTEQGLVRYLQASRVFEIQIGQATRERRLDEVAQVVLAQQPADLQTALSQVRRGQNQEAIPVLTRITEEFAMFGPDVEAGAALLRAHLRSGRAGEAIRVGESLMRRNPRMERQAGFASVFWEALIAEKRLDALRTSLQEAIQSGSRDLAAVALLRRGDLEMLDRRPREALVDGYLRVVLLFRDIAPVQPEALFKAIKAHEELNEVQFAEKWRQRLLANFATSEFAQQLR